MTTCIVCQEITNKYKCPKCLQYYCSVVCYREHKANEESCKELSATQVETLENSEQVEPAVRDPFTTEDTVPLDKLKLLSHCEELKNLLYNPHLRNFLKQVDTASNAAKAMQAAMQEPLFIEFADACLKVIEPDEQENNTTFH